MILLVDIGNTRIKWAQQQAGKLYKIGAITHLDQSINSVLLSAWQDVQAPKKIFLASVGSKKVCHSLFDVAVQLWPNAQIQEIQTKK